MSRTPSELEAIEDIGEVRAGALRSAGFRGVEEIRRAAVEELEAVEGISSRLARQLKDEVGRADEPAVDPDLVDDIRNRFKHWPWERWWWRRRPASVDILLYAESSVKFQNGGFDGLTHVISTLRSDPWFWSTFDLTLAHRGSDSSADVENETLDSLDLESYDELWLFGFSGGDLLTTAEENAVEAFMDDPNRGGVLTTGDHGDLGKGITGSIPRVGKMRNYDVYWDTLRVNPSTGNSTETDDVPQEIRIKEYPEYRFWPRFQRVTHPHPVLCGPEGPIDLLPDHQHEGEVNVPSSYPTPEWPEKNGYQPEVEPIAWGTVVQGNQSGTEFPVVGVYDGHRADVGRIAADSTWHHWFDHNLHGGTQGFDDTARGRDALRQFEAYYLNLAVWLAPPDRQRAMWNALLWGGLWHGPLVMFDPELARGYDFGGRARDALGQFAPQCQIRRWCLDLLPNPVYEAVEELRRPPKPFPDPDPVPGPVPVPIEEKVVGRAVRFLLEEYEDAEDAVEYPGDDVLEEASRHGVEAGVSDLLEYYESASERASRLEDYQSR